MKPKFSSFPFMIPLLPFILLIIVFNLSNIIVVADLVQNTCKICEKNNPNVNYDFCISSFRDNDQGIDPTDLFKLGAISLHLIRNNVSSSIQYVEKLLQNEELDSYRKAHLSDCLEMYGDAFITLEEGKKAYKEKQFGDANVKVSSVMDASRVCEDGFSEKEGFSSPLSKWNNDMFQLTSIALSIINMLS